MTDKIPMREDENLLQTAKNVFGNDIVIKAWVASWQVEGISTREEVSERLNRKRHSSVYKELDLDDNDVVIEFINRRKVYFTVSEWGTVSLLSDNQYYET